MNKKDKQAATREFLERFDSHIVEEENLIICGDVFKAHSAWRFFREHRPHGTPTNSFLETLDGVIKKEKYILWKDGKIILGDRLK